MTDINDIFTKEIKAKHTRWQKNRDILAGADAVRANAKRYLHRLRDGRDPIMNVSPATFADMVPFHPIAGLTSQLFTGLVFRVDPAYSVDETYDDTFKTITRGGLSLASLAKKVFEETLAVNYSGLLVDHAQPIEGLTKANALAAGYRPFLTHYLAEQIRVVDVEVINNRVEYTRVILKDSETVIRELRLVENKYVVIIHTLDERTKKWVAAEPIMPLKNGQPWGEIPFVLVSLDEDNHLPSRAPLDDLIDHNLDHYNAWSDLRVASYCAAQPMIVFSNVDGENASQINLKAGNAIMLTAAGEGSAEPRVEWITSTVGDHHEKMIDRLAAECASIGSRTLGGDKLGVESAETHLIRRTSEFATQQSIAETVSRKITEALAYFCEWAGIEPVELTLNRDFLPKSMSSEEIASKLALYQAGAISLPTLYEMLQQGDVLPADFDAELELDRVANSSIEF